MVSKIICFNMDRMEDFLYMTVGERFESFQLPQNCSVETFRDRISAAEIRRLMKESMKARMKAKIRTALKIIFHKKS